MMLSSTEKQMNMRNIPGIHSQSPENKSKKGKKALDEVAVNDTQMLVTETMQEKSATPLNIMAKRVSNPREPHHQKITTSHRLHAVQRTSDSAASNVDLLPVIQNDHQDEDNKHNSSGPKK